MIRRLPPGWRREIWIAARQTITALLAWLFVYPLTFLFKRDPHLTLVIGRRGPVFADNSKYFFITATEYCKPGERVIFLTNNRSIHDAIAGAGGEAVLHPSWHSLALLLRCGRLVADMSDWFDYGVYPLTQGAERIQIWHGAPLKKIELDLFYRRLNNLPFGLKTLLYLQKGLIGRYPVYDTVVTTSQAFTRDVFSKCFRAKRFAACGYPRNDILLGWSEPQSVSASLIKINVDATVLATVQQAKASGQKIGLYVPTFRKALNDPFPEPMDLERLSELASRQNMILVLKLHPFMAGKYCPNQYPNLLEYPALGDIYPLMAQCDLLITDYSSIFFDFLLLNRPIIFFAPDLEHYVAQDRDFYFDYDSMTPGHKCYTFRELARQLENILRNDCNDGFEARRAKVRCYTHDHTDNQAGRRLLKAMESSRFDEDFQSSC